MTSAVAFSVAASSEWLGNDGQWATFSVQLGTPPQTIYVLPSTSGRELWAVHQLGCSSSSEVNSSTCAERGGAFELEQSTTWNNVSEEYRSLPLSSTQAGSLTQNVTSSIVGIDTVSLGSLGSGILTLEDQLVALYASAVPFLGIFGLSGYNATPVAYNETYRTLLGTFKNSTQTPSQTWGYNAGAYYRRLDGSLTLGGYDASRGNEKDVLTMPLKNDDFTISVTGIAINDSGSEVPIEFATFTAMIDSATTDIWLPKSVCDSVEEAIGIVWNETLRMYIVNDTQHAELSSRNVFTLAGAGDDSQRTRVVLPYAAFNQAARYPLLANATNDTSATIGYFSLKRAETDSQVTLGRTFLQEAYLAADYERQSYNISPALWPQIPNTQLKTIYPIDDPRAIDDTLAAAGENHVPTIVGVVIGSVALIALCGLLWAWKRRRRTKATAASEAKELSADLRSEEIYNRDKPELDATYTARTKADFSEELEAGNGHNTRTASTVGEAVELDDQMLREAPGLREDVEVDGRSRAVELPAERHL